MTITFEIRDITALMNKRNNISVSVTNLNAGGDEMSLASYLTEGVKKLSEDFLNSQNDEDEDIDEDKEEDKKGE